MPDPVETNAKNVDDLKPYLNQINARDGKLALHLWAALLAGDMGGITADLAKAKSEGLTAPAQAIQQFVSTHTFDPAQRTWGDAADVINNAKGLVSAATSSLNPLGALFQANLWLRVGEVALGLILIAVGVAKLTNAVPIATKIARYVK